METAVKRVVGERISWEEKEELGRDASEARLVSNVDGTDSPDFVGRLPVRRAIGRIFGDGPGERGRAEIPRVGIVIHHVVRVSEASRGAI